MESNQVFEPIDYLLCGNINFKHRYYYTCIEFNFVTELKTYYGYIVVTFTFLQH